MTSTDKKILVTGAAGFIGFHVTNRLLREGASVIGVDNLNDYYDPSLKRARLAALDGQGSFEFHRLDLRSAKETAALFESHQLQRVIHLAAQPGVRASVVDPRSTVENNVNSFLNVLEGCRQTRVQHLVYASSSSVYGANTKIPFTVHDSVDHPISLYAATKRANELMAHTYSHLFGLPTTGLRFFTVYGPWGRPDMSYFIFAEAICKGRPIEIYGTGNALRDLTYVDDIVESIVRLMEKPAIPGSGTPEGRPNIGAKGAPFQLFNIGCGSQITVEGMVRILESNMARKAERSYQEERLGDVFATRADVSDLAAHIDFAPRVTVEEGLAKFARWFLRYY